MKKGAGTGACANLRLSSIQRQEKCLVFLQDGAFSHPISRPGPHTTRLSWFYSVDVVNRGSICLLTRHWQWPVDDLGLTRLAMILRKNDFINEGHQCRALSAGFISAMPVLPFVMESQHTYCNLVACFSLPLQSIDADRRNIKVWDETNISSSSNP